MSNLFNTEEYCSYLKKNCGVRGYDFESQDETSKRPDVDVILHYADKLNIGSNMRLLEVGCGFGRILFEIHQKYHIKPYGIDVSPRIVAGAKERVAEISSDIRVSSAEKIDYPDQNFDKIICWGVFDLTTQEQSFYEMSRILNVGGHLLITGKTNRYLANDTEAYLAEKGSLRKNIPNHYSDVANLIRFSNILGLNLFDAWCFKMRGDLSTNAWDPTLTINLKNWAQNSTRSKYSDSFYEYALLFQKNTHITGVTSKNEIGLKRSLVGLELDRLSLVETIDG